MSAKTEEILKITKWVSCMNFRIIIQAVIKSFEWSTDKRTGENLNNAFPYYIYLYTIVNKWALINFFYLHGGHIFEVGLFWGWALNQKGRISYYNTGNSYLIIHLSRNPAKQGLTLLSKQDAALSLWNYDTTFNFFFHFYNLSKVTKKEKKLLITKIIWKNTGKKKQMSIWLYLLYCLD